MPEQKIVLTRGSLHDPLPEDGLDVTYKSAQGFALALAPQPFWVAKRRQGTMSDLAFKIQYLKDLETNVNPAIVQALEAFAERHHGTITFLCYCRTGFCHTHFLIDFLCGHYPATFTTPYMRTIE